MTNTFSLVLPKARLGEVPLGQLVSVLSAIESFFSAYGTWRELQVQLKPFALEKGSASVTCQVQGSTPELNGVQFFTRLEQDLADNAFETAGLDVRDKLRISREASAAFGGFKVVSAFGEPGSSTLVDLGHEREIKLSARGVQHKYTVVKGFIVRVNFEAGTISLRESVSKVIMKVTCDHRLFCEVLIEAGTYLNGDSRRDLAVQLEGTLTFDARTYMPREMKADNFKIISEFSPANDLLSTLESVYQESTRAAENLIAAMDRELHGFE